MRHICDQSNLKREKRVDYYCQRNCEPMAAGPHKKEQKYWSCSEGILLGAITIIRGSITMRLCSVVGGGQETHYILMLTTLSCLTTYLLNKCFYSISIIKLHQRRPGGTQEILTCLREVSKQYIRHLINENGNWYDQDKIINQLRSTRNPGPSLSVK